MKKISIVLSFCIIAFTGRAQWLTNLNDGGSMPQFGIRTAHPLSFYTNNTLRMTLDADGKLGIGKSNPAAALDVTGNGGFSGNLRASALILGGDLNITHALGSSGSPNLTSFNSGSTSDPYIPPTPLAFHSVCDVAYTSIPTSGPATNYRVTFSPQNANLFSNLIQISDQAQNAALSFGLLNGSGIIALEPISGFTGVGNEALKLNPGCKMDVNICEGGGYTKMFGGAGVVGNLNVSTRVKIGTPSGVTSALDIDEPGLPNGITVSNASSPVFGVANNGNTYIGANIYGGNSILTVGQANKTNMAFSLTDNGVSPNKDFFNVYGNGYTEIKVYNPMGMPTPYGTTNPRVFTIRDASSANRDLFVVRADGKVYAREVEINLTANFPDYVFDAGYKLKPVAEVADYINQNKHLPGYETAAHYEKNGINVNDMLIKQQEKIEEQMLYIIQQDKKMLDLEKRMQALEKSK